MSLFSPVSSECLFADSTLPDSGHLAELDLDSQLVWIERAPVDPSLLPPTFMDDFDAFLDGLSSHSTFGADTQVPLEQTFIPELHYRSGNAVLISMDPIKALSVDTLLPPFWKSTLVSQDTVAFLPVPDEDVQRVEKILGHLAFQPEIASIGLNIRVSSSTPSSYDTM